MSSRSNTKSKSKSKSKSLSVRKSFKNSKKKETPVPFSLLQPSTWWTSLLKPKPVYEPEPVYAYVLITLHGSYSLKKNDPSNLPRNLRDLPSEPFLEPNDTFTLNDTGIKTLKWIRAVPGGVINYTTNDEIDIFYQAVKDMAAAKTLDIPRDIFKRTSITVTDLDFSNTRSKHYEEKNFMDMDLMLNKSFDVTEGDMLSDPKDFRIWLMNTETDITTQVLKKQDENYHGNLKDVLNWLKKNGYDHVVLVDLSCAAAFVGPDILTGVTERSLAKLVHREINKRGGKKKNTQTRRKKIKRGKTRGPFP